MKTSKPTVTVRISAGPLPHLTREEILNNQNTVAMVGEEIHFTPSRDRLMEQHVIDQIAERGHGTVRKVLHEATILREGWEMDNQGWIVEMADGTIKAFTTSHGGVYPWAREQAEAHLKETERSAESIRAALAVWPD